MRHATLLLTVLLTLAMVGCGGDTHEKAADDLVGLIGEVGTILEDVDDKDSAENAKEELVALADEFSTVAKRMTDLGEPGDELEQELEEKYSDQLKEITQKITEEMMRIVKIDPTLMSDIQEGMDEISTAMEDAQPDWAR